MSQVASPSCLAPALSASPTPAPPEERAPSARPMLCGMAAFLLGITIAAYVGMDHVLSREEEADGEKPVEVAADALYRELQADLPAAELKYRNKLVRLSGSSARAGKGP